MHLLLVATFHSVCAYHVYPMDFFSKLELFKKKKKQHFTISKGLCVVAVKEQAKHFCRLVLGHSCTVGAYEYSPSQPTCSK